MGLIDDLFTKLKNKNIFFEIERDPDDNRIFILKTQSTVLAIGVEVEDEINYSTEFGISKQEYLKRFHDFYYQLAEPLNGVSKESGRLGRLSFIFFFISENYIVIDPDFWGEWTCYDPEDNLNEFFLVLSNLPELKTEEQKKKDEMFELKSNINDLERKILKLIDANKKLDQSLSYFQKGRDTLGKENKEIKEQMYSQNIINEKLIKEVDYLKNIVKAKTISRLSNNQIKCLKERGVFPLRIELELLYPSLILEFNTFTYRNWGNTGDAMPIPVTDFLEIDVNGNVSILTSEQLTSIENFPGFIWEKGSMSHHLIGSVLITKEDFDNSF
jgi:hypothetical protein